MLFDRFFGRVTKKSVPAPQRGTGHQSQRPAGLRLRMEPLEDRALLSINPFVGPFTYDQIAAGQSMAGTALTSSANCTVSTPNSISAQDGTSATTSTTATHYVVSVRAGTTIGAPVSPIHA